ncbi:MAG: signal peptidase II [Oscillospiraceae bacterium]|nr:signal peptidase II [Oscillospiraceae bacterium]
MHKWLALTMAAALAAVDQLIKLWALSSLAGSGIAVIPGVFSLILVRNTGAAFGLLSGQRIFLIIMVSLVILCGIIAVASGRVNSKPLVWIISLIIAGGIGNLIDRIYLGYVVDYLSFGSFPVFNFADCCVVSGTFLLAVYMLRKEKSDIGAENTDPEGS